MVILDESDHGERSIFCQQPVDDCRRLPAAARTHYRQQQEVTEKQRSNDSDDDD